MKDKQALLEAISAGAVTVTFTKADSSTREMKCTQAEALMTEYSYDAGEKEALAIEATESGLVRAYDLEAHGWRSFKTDTVQNWAQA